VNAKIGQPPHKADRKYHIEAFLLSIQLRLMLGQIASARISELPLTSKEPDHPRHRQIWVTFVGFLYDSCLKDCEKATSLARSCSSLRQEARIKMLNIRCTFEKVRSDALEERRKIQISDENGELRTYMRERLGRLVARQQVAAMKELFEFKTRYFQDRPIDSGNEMNKERLWFRENCTSRADKVFAAYTSLQEQVIKSEVFYQSMSLQEKEDIVKAFGFGHAGHFYNCENGHTFVITECGGAMEASRCPECRAPIGGGDHRLVTSNTRAVEFEQIARGSGAQGNPWAPGGYLANGL